LDSGTVKHASPRESIKSEDIKSEDFNPKWLYCIAQQWLL
jgi:hypothetical protein